MKFSEIIKNEFSNPINLIASILTIINFIFSLNFLPSSKPLILPSFPINFLPFQIILFILIQSFIASGFGYLMTNISIKGKGLPFIITMVLSLFSAWTSLFNIQWVFQMKNPTETPTIQLLLLCAFISLLISNYFLKFHWSYIFDKVKQKDNLYVVRTKDFWAALWGLQFLSFFVMYLVVIRDYLPKLNWSV